MKDLISFVVKAALLILTLMIIVEIVSAVQVVAGNFTAAIVVLLLGVFLMEIFSKVNLWLSEWRNW